MPSELNNAELAIVKSGRQWLVKRRVKWGGYYIRVGIFAPGGDSFIATAVRHKPAEDGHPLAEPGDLWFEYASTVDEALSRLKRSLAH